LVLFLLRLRLLLFRARPPPLLLRDDPDRLRDPLALFLPLPLSLSAAAALLRRVAAPLRAAAEREALDRERVAPPLFLPPFRDALLVLFFPRPDPLFLPPPSSLFTVAQARRSASRRETPRFS